MWGSLAVGQSNQEFDMGSPIQSIVASTLVSHPLVNETIAKSIASETIVFKEEDIPAPNYAPFCITGEGWFEDKLGKSATDVVRELRKARRIHKGAKEEIDTIISNVIKLKSMEVDATLSKLDWGIPYRDTMRQLGLSDKSLKSLRIFGKSREISLTRACNTWEKAESTLKQLDEFEDVWGEEERLTWVNAMQLRKDARKMWKGALHQFDNLSKEQQKWLNLAKEEMEVHGPMTARAITENLILKGVPRISATRVSKLLNMYGEEISIIKAHRKGEYMCMNRDGLIIKDAWAYAAGFLDADGYITITERGEPRAGFIATGDRGRTHCEELHKNIGAGKLQLDQKVYKNGQRSQHRVSFYSKDDLAKLLLGITPHLRMKDRQAKAVSAYILESDPLRRSEIKRFVQFSNREGTQKGEESLKEWGVDRDTVMSWAPEV